MGELKIEDIPEEIQEHYQVFIAFHRSDGMDVLASCKKCHAMVNMEFAPEHIDWHKTLGASVLGFGGLGL